MTSRAEIQERVLRVVQDVLAIDDPPALGSSLAQDLGADSLDLLSLFMALEDEFGGVISEREAEAIDTLGDVVTVIEGRLAADVGT